VGGDYNLWHRVGTDDEVMAALRSLFGLDKEYPSMENYYHRALYKELYLRLLDREEKQ
jgi:hypothetical protein